MINNMSENCFSYRIVFLVNEGNKNKKYYIDTMYRDLRKSLEGIIRKYLSMTNNIVISQTTVMRNGKCVCLQNKPYSFSLDEYLRKIIEINNNFKEICIKLCNGFKMN